MARALSGSPDLNLALAPRGLRIHLDRHHAPKDGAIFLLVPALVPAGPGALREGAREVARSISKGSTPRPGSIEEIGECIATEILREDRSND